MGQIRSLRLRGPIEEKRAPFISEGATEVESGLFPLGPAQRRLWFLQRYDEDSSSYNIARASRLAGPLDLTLLKRAFEAVADRHEILRTTYPERNGAPLQAIDPVATVDFLEVDLSSHGEAALDSYLNAEAKRPFDLACGPVWRVRVATMGEADHVLLTVIHHIAADGWSFPQLRSEVSIVYRALMEGRPADLPDLPIQYRDFARSQVETPVTAQQEAFWVEKLGHDPDPLPLPSDRPRSRHRTSRGGWVDFTVPGTADGTLREVATRLDGSPFMVGLALFAGFLGRLAGTADVVVGVPSAERTAPETQHLIGPLINSLPIRIRVGAGASLRELVATVRAEVLAAIDNSIPFEEIVRLTKPRREPSHTPLFQVMFQNREGSFRSDHALPGIVERFLRVESSASKFDLLLELGGDGGALNYSADLFDRETAVTLAEAFAVMSSAALANPDLPLVRLPLVTPWERDWLLADLNDTARPLPLATDISRLFEEVVATQRDSLAVEDGDLRLTFGELLDGAKSIASQLQKAGVAPGHPVGLRFTRSATMIAAQLAVLQLGAVYVPLDPTYPTERLQQMIDAAGMSVVLAPQPDVGWLAVQVIQTGLEPRHLDFTALPAYVMFTSGSTGLPKGVVVPHRAIIRLVCNTDYVSLGPGDVIAHLSNVSFDAATFEVWGALLNGAAISIIDTDAVLDVGRLAGVFHERSVTTVFVTTALFNLIAKHAPSAFSSVREVLFGGERCDPDSVRRVLDAGPPQRLVHVYGPTETTTFATWHEIEVVDDQASTIPIGAPIANTTLYVLDPFGGVLPRGLVGELHIGGPGVALGYLDDSSTRERFLPNPFSDDLSDRMYRTGDLVRRRADGEIEFVGRKDRQIKLRGFRIEPAEIEEMLLRHPSVAAAVVSTVETGRGHQLGAWVVPRRDGHAEAGSLRQHLEGLLPSFMIPSFINVIPAMPLAPHGKVDVARLPAPESRPTASIGGADARMVAVFERVLGIDGITPSDSFFDLGGHSLLAVELIAAIETEFGVRLPLSTLFASASATDLASRLERGDTGPLEQGLVLLKGGGQSPPVFVFHHPSGTVMAYEPLARHLGDEQTVYGIQARGVDGGAKPFKSIKEMAVEYADLIERTDPGGQYRLVGHSLGGLLAWETARLLQMRGHQVPFLALLDALFPDRRWFKAGVIDGNPASATQMMLREARRAAGDVRWGVRWAMYGAKRKPIPPTEARLRLLRASSRAFDRYRPEAFIGKVVYIEATETQGTAPRNKAESWARMCAELEVVKVPGSHSGPDSIIGPEHVEVVGIELRKRLEELVAVEGQRA